MSTVALLRTASEPSRREWSIGIGQTTMLFGGAALLLFGVTHGIIPALAERTTIEPILLWFGAAGLGVFLPLLLFGIARLRQKGVHLLTSDIRLRIESTDLNLNTSVNQNKSRYSKIKSRQQELDCQPSAQLRGSATGRDTLLHQPDLGFPRSMYQPE